MQAGGQAGVGRGASCLQEDLPPIEHALPAPLLLLNLARSALGGHTLGLPGDE
jgi:hypothetical protein